MPRMPPREASPRGPLSRIPLRLRTWSGMLPVRERMELLERVPSVLYDLEPPSEIPEWLPEKLLRLPEEYELRLLLELRLTLLLGLELRLLEEKLLRLEVLELLRLEEKLEPLRLLLEKPPPPRLTLELLLCPPPPPLRPPPPRWA